MCDPKPLPLTLRHSCKDSFLEPETMTRQYLTRSYCGVTGSLSGHKSGLFAFNIRDVGVRCKPHLSRKRDTERALRARVSVAVCPATWWQRNSQGKSTPQVQLLFSHYYIIRLKDNQETENKATLGNCLLDSDDWPQTYFFCVHVLFLL